MLAAITGVLAAVRNVRTALGVLSPVPVFLSESPNTARAKTVASVPLMFSAIPNAAVGHLVQPGLGLSAASNAARGGAVTAVPIGLLQPNVQVGTVVLHLHFDGVDGSTTFTDSSPVPKTPLSVVTPLSVTNTSSKFSGSGNFTSGYLQYADSPDWALGSGDFTIEFWANWNAASVGARSIVFGKGGTNGQNDPVGLNKNTGGTLNFGGNFSDGSTYNCTSTNTISANTWYFIACVRSGLNFYLFVNGALWASTSIASSKSLLINTSNFGVGIDGDYVSAGYGGPFGTRMMGLLDEFRITKGAARYTAPFTVPSLPFGESDASFASVCALMHFDGTNGAITFTDSSVLNNTWTRFGAATLSTTSPQFGTASLSLTGIPDSLHAVTPSNFFLSTNDYTIEMWFKPTTLTAGKGYYLWSQSENLVGAFAYTYIGVNTLNGVSAWVQPTTGGAGVQILSASSLVTTNTWYHIALTRQGVNAYLWLNGQLVGSSTAWLTFPNAKVQHTAIGGIGNGYTDSSVNTFVGNIDEVRVTNGVARYTANFTPQIAAFPNQ